MPRLRVVGDLLCRQARDDAVGHALHLVVETTAERADRVELLQNLTSGARRDVLVTNLVRLQRRHGLLPCGVDSRLRVSRRNPPRHCHLGVDEHLHLRERATAATVRLRTPRPADWRLRLRPECARWQLWAEEP